MCKAEVRGGFPPPLFLAYATAVNPIFRDDRFLHAAVGAIQTLAVIVQYLSGLGIFLTMN